MSMIPSARAGDQNCAVSWCEAHLPTDAEQVTHITAEYVVTQTAGGRNEQGQVYVSLDRLGDGATRVLIDGDQVPMTPLEALRLSAVLQELALDALEAPADADETRRWAQAIAATPTEDFAAAYSYGVIRADRVRAVVADLLAQAEVDQ